MTPPEGSLKLATIRSPVICSTTEPQHSILTERQHSTHEVLNCCQNAVKPVLSGHSKIDETKVLKTNSSLMKAESIAEFSVEHSAIVESIAECSLKHSAIFLTCIKQ